MGVLINRGWTDRARAALRRRLRAPVAWAIEWRERRVVDGFPHQLAVCAIFREEAPFLDEWLSFHRGVGATHFYLYNNFSTDNFRAVLAPWIARGMVTLIDWPVAVGQLAAYRHCLRRARRECRWLALIDVDEFLFSPLSTNICAILDRYADLPGLCVWELFFGANGHVTRPALPVTAAYLRRAPLSHASGKTIANPRLIYKIGFHQCKYWRGADLDTSRTPVVPGRTPVLDVLRINHYWSRSLADLDVKISRGDASSSGPRARDWHLWFERSLNAERDDSILPVAQAIAAARADGLPSTIPHVA